jgi:GT2 family glycosyltransferase
VKKETPKLQNEYLFSEDEPSIMGYVDVSSFEVRGDSAQLHLVGWFFHRSRSIVRIEVIFPSIGVGNFKLKRRADIASTFPKFKTALRTGFEFHMDMPMSMLSGPTQKFDLPIFFRCFDSKDKLIFKFGRRQSFTGNFVPDHSLQRRQQLESQASVFNRIEFQRYLNFVLNSGTIKFRSHRKPVLSIVIVTYNQPILVLKCLRDLSYLSVIPFEVIIVDNNSEHSTKHILSRVSGARIVLRSENYHFLKSANFGAKLARGSKLLFLNSDCFVFPGSIESCLKVLDEDSAIGAVGPKILNIDGSIQEAGSVIFKDGSTSPYGMYQMPNSFEVGYQREVDYVSGAFLLTTKLLFKKVGGFDERYSPAYYEDTDYCTMLRKVGHRVVYNPLATVVHFMRGSSANKEEPNLLMAKNQKLFFQKHKNILSKKLTSDLGLFRAGISNVSKLKKIFFIDDQLPFTHNGAGFPRSNKIISILAERGHHVTVFGVHSNPKDRHLIYSLPKKIEVVDFGGMINLERILESRKESYDVIWVSRPEIIKLVTDLFKRRRDLVKGVELILDSEAVITPRKAKQWEIGAANNFLRRPGNRELMNEIGLYRRGDKVIAVSEPDSKILKRSKRRVETLGHCHSTVKKVESFWGRSNFLFIGPLTDVNSPNYDSMQWFLSEVWPKIRSQIPKAQLHCVGRIDDEIKKKFGSKGVLFLNLQESLEEYYKTYRVFIAPTRFAAGIPYKCTEAASWGIPQVITSVLAEQLGWKDGEQCLISDRPDEFAQACVSIYCNSKVWNKISENLVRFSQKNYSQKKFESKLFKIINL